MSNIIIGIHGLANKPEQVFLEEYWKTSILEGLENVGGGQDGFEFKLVYWANFLYRNQMHQEAGLEFDSLFNNEPYIPARPGSLVEHDDNWKDAMRKITGGVLGSGTDWLKQNFNIESIANIVLSKKLKDLDYYYQDKPVKTRNGEIKGAKSVLRGELETALQQSVNDEVMLISHSMGTIIAYDVLRNLGQTNSDVSVQHFVTIGSPLGLPHVKQQVVDERTKEGFDKADEVRTPSVVTKSWMNFADPLDPVALDTHLSDDYDANGSSVEVKDDIVENDYVGNGGERNHHKSYGYLRTPELSKHIRTFVES